MNKNEIHYEAVVSLKRYGYYIIDIGKQEGLEYFKFIKENPYVKYEFKEDKKVLIKIPDKYVMEKTNRI